MKRIHKVIAICGSSALLTLTLTPAALAAGSVSGATAGRAITVPNSNIKGSPAHWSPSSLTAKARWPKSDTTCTASVVSFTMTNKENKAEHVTVTGTNGFNTLSGSISPHNKAGICVRKGYSGTVHATLKDGKKLTVHF